MKTLLSFGFLFVLAACKTDPDALLGGGPDVPWRPENLPTQSCRYKLVEVDDNKAACDKPELEAVVYGVTANYPVTGGQEQAWTFKKVPGEDGVFPTVKQIEYIRYATKFGDGEQRWGNCSHQNTATETDSWVCRLYAINQPDENERFRMYGIVVANEKCGRVVEYQTVANGDCSGVAMTEAPVYAGNIEVPFVVTERPNSRGTEMTEEVME